MPKHLVTKDASKKNRDKEAMITEQSLDFDDCLPANPSPSLIFIVTLPHLWLSS